MKTIAIISQKGGSGKTTLCIHLAVASERANQTAVVVDLDPQASSTAWRDVREGDTPAVVPAQANRLPLILQEAAKHGADLAIIDTSPNSESASLAASRSSDFILIPCRPNLLDLQAITISVELARIASRPYAVVLNAVPPTGSLAENASSALSDKCIVQSPIHLGHRAAYYHCLNKGQVAQEYDPVGKASEEVFQLYRWLQNQLAANVAVATTSQQLPAAM